jgi:predicted  nucleic acid-binding Zn-ribbon protein
MSTKETIECKECGAVLDDPSEENRNPCPKCGSMLRNIKIEITETIKVYDSINYKHKDPTKTRKAKVLAEGFSGYEYSHSRKKTVLKQRLIDRKDDLYREIIIDPETGEVIHKCEESLKQHKGHGSAKLNRGRRNKKES